MERICVFCGSNSGNREEYEKLSWLLGAMIARRGLELVYGGGNVGLMGVLARSVLEHGSRAIGVIPEDIYYKVQHIELSELIIVNNMHERKAKMYELSDAFIALPGGIGTLEELFEVYTWQQLDYHSKPIGLFNINGYYNRLIDFLHHSVEQGFFSRQHLDNLIISDKPGELFSMIQNATPVFAEKWL